jgi:hypothetical protein
VDGDGGVEERDLAPCGFGLGQGVARVGLVEEDLALEVRGLDEVAVDQGKGADAGAREQRSGGGAGGATTDQRDVRLGEPPLARFADAGKELIVALARADSSGVLSASCAGRASRVGDWVIEACIDG